MLRPLGHAEAERQGKADDDTEKTDQESVLEPRKRVKITDSTGLVQNGTGKDLKNSDTEKRCRVEHS